MLSNLTKLTELASSGVDIKIQIQNLTSLLLRSWNHAPKQYCAFCRPPWVDKEEGQSHERLLPPGPEIIIKASQGNLAES